MATVSIASRTVFGNKRVRIVDFTFDSSYPDNGEALSASDIGLRQIDAVIPCGPARKSDGSLAVPVSYDHTNSKLLAYWGDNNNAADAPLIEVADTTDLSTYAVKLICIGTG